MHTPDLLPCVFAGNVLSSQPTQLGAVRCPDLNALVHIKVAIRCFNWGMFSTIIVNIIGMARRGGLRRRSSESPRRRPESCRTHTRPTCSCPHLCKVRRQHRSRNLGWNIGYVLFPALLDPSLEHVFTFNAPTGSAEDLHPSQPTQASASRRAAFTWTGVCPGGTGATPGPRRSSRIRLPQIDVRGRALVDAGAPSADVLQSRPERAYLACGRNDVHAGSQPRLPFACGGAAGRPTHPQK